ncbi:MAG: TlpA family protein disulfide reductase, partial [Crocinitomicaceae bacterium]
KAASTLSFPNLKRNFNKGEDFDVPDGYYSCSDTIQKDNPLALLSSYYDAFLTQYLQQEMSRVAHENSYDGQIKVLYEEFGSKVADIKATKVIYQGIRTKHLDSKDQSLLIAEHKSKFPESEAIEFIMEEHSKALVSANGKPAFNGVVENTDGNMVELLKYSGKPLLIDVWASWCSPCLKNMKFLEPIKEKYKDELCVIYVSVDEKSKDWITAIEKNNLSANVNYLTRGKQSEFARFYDISSIPRYILIDKEGNIANNNAPSPAKRELLLAEIEKLIN